MKYLSNLMCKEYGQGMVEYALILGFASIAAVLALTEIGKKDLSFFRGIIFP